MVGCRTTRSSISVFVFGVLISQISQSNQCFLPCNFNLGLEGGCNPRFGLQIGGPPCGCLSQGLIKTVCSCLENALTSSARREKVKTCCRNKPPLLPSCESCPPPDLCSKRCPCASCPCNEIPFIPSQPFDCGPTCPCQQNLPFELQSPCAPCVPPLKQYKYEVDMPPPPPCCQSCNCQPLSNLPPAIVEVPLQKPLCPCKSYKYDIIKPVECPPIECQPKLNLPFWKESPCSPTPPCDCGYKYPYSVQQPMVPVVEQPNFLNIGFNVESPVPPIPPPQLPLCNLKPTVDCISTPRNCPCMCNPSLQATNICRQLPTALPPAPCCACYPPAFSPMCLTKKASLRVY